MLVLLPTFKPVLQQIRLLQVAKICCRKQRVVLLSATNSVNVARFTRPRQTCFAATCVTPVYGVTPEVSIHATCSNLFFFETGLNVGGKTSNIAFQLVLHQCCKASCTFLLPVLPRLYARAVFQLLSSHYGRRLREQSQNYRKNVIVVYIVHNTQNASFQGCSLSTYTNVVNSYYFWHLKILLMNRPISTLQHFLYSHGQVHHHENK